MVLNFPTLTVDGVALVLEVRRKNVKHVNARLRGDLLKVSVPLRLGDHEAMQAVEALARRLVRRARARVINGEETAHRLALRIASRFPAPPAVRRVTFVTTQQTRWGSYSPRTGTIRLHAALRLMPLWVLEAVMAHELAHVDHLDHSPAFHRLLGRVCPENERATAFLTGVSWTVAHWMTLPSVERELLRPPLVRPSSIS